MKKNFAEPEMEVVRFNAQEIVTATSCSVDSWQPGSCSGDGTGGIDME